MSDPRDTPAMRQHRRFKDAHPGCVLFFRMGDFYELFFEDAVLVSKLLGLTLTQRTEGVPMAGVPHHQLDAYLRRALAAGLRVAVADQIQDPKDAKGLVERAVTRVVTSGTRVDDALLDDASPGRLAAAAFVETPGGVRAGLAIVEASTGAFEVLDCAPDDAGDELARRGVCELLYSEVHADAPPERVRRALQALGVSGVGRPAWHFRRDEALDAVRSVYRVSGLGGFGLSEDDPALPAVGVVLRYLLETQAPEIRPGARASVLSHLRPPVRTTPEGRCVVDTVSLRALEVERTLRGSAGDEVEGSLLGLFLRARVGQGACRTPMGRRLVRDWLCAPLGRAEGIRARQSCVATLVDDVTTAEALGRALDVVQDVPRIAGRLALGRATPRDVVALGRSLGSLAPVVELLSPAPAFTGLVAQITPLRVALGAFGEDVLARCVDGPPAHLREGGLFRDGFDAELDEARLLHRDAGRWLAEFQARLALETGIAGLKVGFNQVFGYYVELTAAQARDAGERAERAGLVRKQTLRNAERYTTPELREFESRVTTAEARAVEREQTLFRSLCERGAGLAPELGTFGDVFAELDALLAFAQKARHMGWRRPEIVEESALVIHAGRHPVLDELLRSDFVPNDVELGPDGPPEARASLALITGPNMAGKSTFIRQVALLTLLTHAGSFIPADRATIGVCDRIFTRVGADDALHRGQSTFMVEMTETAGILNHATPRSLVVLDEIGRGTSTLDGLSLAWAIAEHLAGGLPGDESAVTEGRGPRTLFATHYHELTELQDRLPERVMNLQVLVREWTDPEGRQEIVFLHRIGPGRADQSYGLHVARLAGLPRGVVARAREVLDSLSVSREGDGPGGAPPPRPEATRAGQLSLFTEYLDHPAVSQLRELKLDRLSPLEAFDALRRLKASADARE